MITILTGQQQFCQYCCSRHPPSL